MSEAFTSSRAKQADRCQPRFNVSTKAAAAPPVAAAVPVPETSLQDLAAASPLPIRPVTTTGRVHWICASSRRYRQYKFILGSEGQEGVPETFMMCKCSSIPGQAIALRFSGSCASSRLTNVMEKDRRDHGRSESLPYDQRQGTVHQFGIGETQPWS